jgi:hypothetical protein
MLRGFSQLRAGLAIAFVFGSISMAAFAYPSVTLSWSADNDPNTAGYIVYSGTVSGAYTQALFLGNVTTTTISNLPSGPVYFFAVASYDSSGVESPPSNEVNVIYSNGTTTNPISSVSPSYTVGNAAVTGTSVTFAASVNPNGCEGPAADPANVYISWQFGLASGSYAQSTAAEPIGIGSTAVPVTLSMPTAGMAATIFHYQMVISSAYGYVYGPDQTFSLAQPAVVNTAVSTMSTTSALSLTVNPNGLDTKVSIQYGLTTAYSSGTVSVGDIGSGLSAVTLTPTLTGLQPNTPYHYRVVTTNALGTFYGPDQVFEQAAYGTAVLLSSQAPAPGIPGATLNKFGNPATNALGHTAFQSTIQGSSKIVKTTNNSGIWAESGTSGLCLIVRTGMSAPDYTGSSTVGVFSTLSDPVYANDDSIAFLGKLVMSGTVSSVNDMGIWATTSGKLTLVARAYDPAPDANGVTSSSSPLFSSFSQFVLPDSGGIIFLGNLALYAGGVSNQTNQGIWAVGTDGVMRRILCKGDSLSVNGAMKTISTLSIFNAPAASTGQSRHFGNAGGLLYKVTFTDGSNSVVQSMYP